MSTSILLKSKLSNKHTTRILLNDSDKRLEIDEKQKTTVVYRVNRVGRMIITFNENKNNGT